MTRRTKDRFMTTAIHPTAIIDPTACIDPCATIGPYCIVGADSIIGPDTCLQHHVVVGPYTTLGARNQVFAFAVIGEDPQDRKYTGEETTCTIGDDNTIREYVTVHRGTDNAGGVTSIGDSNLIMVGAHVAHDCRIGSECTIANLVMLGGHVQVDDHANLGGGAGVHHFVKIGEHAFIAGMSKIVKDVPPFLIAEGVPAEVRAVNKIGMRRAGFSEEDVTAIKDAFRLLYGRNAAPMSAVIPDLIEKYPMSTVVEALCASLQAIAVGVNGRSLEVARADDKWAVPG